MTTGSLDSTNRVFTKYEKEGLSIASFESAYDKVMSPRAFLASNINEFRISAGGNRFEPVLERALDSDLRALASRLPGSDKGILGAVEFPGPRGVPDFLAVVGAADDMKARISLGEPYLVSQSDCAIVATLHIYRTRTAEAVSDLTGITVPQVEKRLQALARRNFVIKTGAGYRRSSALQPIGRMYAFEAKVSDWRRGLNQALRYSFWSDASSLVLLRPPVDIDQLRRRCEALNIGLAVRSRWIRRPRIGRPHAGLRLAASERLAFEISSRE